MTIEITNVLKTDKGLVFKFNDETSLAFDSLGNLTSSVSSTDVNIMAYLNEVTSYLKSKNIKEQDNPVTELETGKSKSEIEFYDKVAIAAMQSYMLDETRITSASDRIRFAFDMADLMLAERRRRLGAQR